LKVIQPEVQHVNQDQTASISCEYDPHGSKFKDVRLYRIPQNAKGELLCQNGLASCKDVNLSSSKFVFTLQNISPEAMRATYQCEITVEYNNMDYFKSGTNTTLFYDKFIQYLIYALPFRNEKEMLCQKGQASCKDVTLTLNSTMSVFTLQNISPETMRATYQCEIIVEHNGVNYTKSGTNTTLIYGEKDCPPLDKSALGRVLIGLLALMFLYSCVITCLYARLTVTVWKNTKACENSTYVIMNRPTHKRQHEDIYQMMQS
ncbi:hypothetical protein CCH79_00017165, partial [Gambusia affinis]